MSILKELFDRIVEVAQQAAGVDELKIVPHPHDPDRFFQCAADGCVEVKDERPHWVFHCSLESLLAWGERNSEENLDGRERSAYWVSDEAVLCETKRGAVDQAVGMFKLTETEAICCLDRNEHPAALEADDLRSLFRYELKEAGDWSELLAMLKAINWKSVDQEATTYDAARESMGRDIEMSAANAEGLDDKSLTFHAPFFQGLPREIEPATLDYQLQILLRQRKFALRPVGDAIAEARRRALLAVRTYIHENVDENRPTYIGSPRVRRLIDAARD